MKNRHLGRDGMNNDKLHEIFSDYPDCLTVSNLQTMLNVGKNTAYKLLETDKIQYRRIGKKYLIPKVSVIEYLFDTSALVNNGK